MLTITCGWIRNDPATRELAEEHRYETIKLQIATAGCSIVCRLKRDACEYELVCPEPWFLAHFRHLLTCDRLVVEEDGR